MIMADSEYAELERLRKLEHKRRAFKALEVLQQEARRQQPDLTAEDAYRIAGFSEEVIREALLFDQELAEREAARKGPITPQP